MHVKQPYYLSNVLKNTLKSNTICQPNPTCVTTDYSKFLKKISSRCDKISQALVGHTDRHALLAFGIGTIGNLWFP